MYIQVRTMDGKQLVRLDGLSKLTKIEEIRELLVDQFNVEPERQRLFFSGKQLENDHTLFDYNVGLNALIQIMIKPPNVEEQSSNDNHSLVENGVKENGSEENLHIGENGDISEHKKENGEISEKNKTDQVNNNFETDPRTSKADPMKIRSFFKAGDLVDAKDTTMGAWFEAKVVKVTKNDDDQVVYHVYFEDTGGSAYFICRRIFKHYDEDEILQLNDKEVRPRARTKLDWDEIYEGQTVMANYNPDEPSDRGFWYDVIVTRKVSKRMNKELYGKLLLGRDDNAAQECRILFIDEIFKIEKAGENTAELTNGDAPERRKVKPDCSHCKDDPTKPCKECSCHECGGKNDPDKQILCDECDMAYHLTCLNPPLESLPEEDEWYCHLCRNDPSQIVRAGEKLKESKKKAKMPSASTASKRDWGKGMACCGRTKVCTIVPANHYGPIPGVPVGSLWRFRLQVSEAGIHRPPVGGIHGKENEGAYSLVLAGGYEDDWDNGDEFYYTGSGGRDLSGNKRTAEQSCDQKLTKMNRALAKNCDAPLSESGGEAKDWRKGKPVRVVRSCKFRKHSKYAPEEGVRYDGIYKIVKYWPGKGQSGFLVWRYLLRRDDETPAPWTKEGKQIIKELGLTLQYPEGYLEAQAKKEEEKNKLKGISTPGKENGKGKRKREDSTSPEHSPVKKLKNYSLPDHIICAVEADNKNKKIWKELTKKPENYQKFLSDVGEKFLCICCQEVVFEPVTTACGHNTCKACLSRAYKAGVDTCPICRHPLGKNPKLAINIALDNILRKLFPGYEAGR